MAKIDLIDPSVNLLLIDCELRRVEGFREAYVRIPDLNVLLRYFLEPGFPFEFNVLFRQLHLDLCRHLGLPVGADESCCAVLSDFLMSPRWKEWVATHTVTLSAKEAVLAYVQGR
jgi:hypothetical protein